MKQNQTIKLSELTPHPYNAVLYDFESPEAKDVIKALADDIKKDGLYEPIGIDKNNVIFTGNSRYYAYLWFLKEEEIEYYIVKDTFDKNNEKYDEEQKLLSYNGKKLVSRDEKKFMVACRTLTELMQSYADKHNNKTYPKMMYQSFATERSINLSHLQQMMKVYNGHTYKNETIPANLDLVKQVDNQEITPKKALDLSRNVHKDNLLYDEDRHKWISDFKREDVRDNILKIAKQLIQHDMNNTYVTNDNRTINVVTDEQHGEEENFISTNISNKFQAAVSITIDEILGYKSVHTSKQESGLEDIRIPELSRPADEHGEYHPERIEIKCGMNQPTAAGTVISSGIGARTIKPHEFLVVIHDDTAQRYFVMLTTLTKDDWTSHGPSKTRMSLTKWFSNHYENKDDYTILCGDIYKSKNTVHVTCDKL